MKILLLIDNLDSGGAQRQIVNLAKALKQKGHDIHIMTYSLGDHFQAFLRAHEIPIIEIPKNFTLKYAGLFIHLRKAIRGIDPDILCAYLFRPSILALLVKPFLKDTKVVVSERSYHGLERGITPKITRSLYGLADKIVTNSHHQYEFLRRKFPKCNDKIHTILNGIDLLEYTPTYSLADKEGINILAVGHVNHIKNPKLLIRTMAELNQKFPNKFKVTWVGRNYDRIGKINDYYKECVQLIKNLNMESCWTWTGKQYNVTAFYKEADCLVHTSIGEGFPNVIIESLAMGCPVIASNILDHPKIIKNEFNGFLFETDNVSSLKKALLDFSNLTHEKRFSLCQNARKTAVENFSLEKLVYNYEKLFLEN